MKALPADKATQQKQLRMIKNRESAARSREEKRYLFCIYFDEFLIMFVSLFLGKQKLRCEPMFLLKFQAYHALILSCIIFPLMNLL